MTLAMRGAVVIAVIGGLACASGDIRVRVAAGVLILATLAVYARGWQLHERPCIAQSWPAFSCEMRGAWTRLTRRSEIPTLLAVVVITLVGLLLRLQYLFQPIRYDEAFTLTNFAAVPLWVGLSSYYAPNNHLLHTLLVHVTQSVFGTAEWALRVPAFIAGVLLIPMTYLAGRSVYSPAGGVLAAALVAGSAVFVEFSTNARGYTLLSLILLTLIALATQLTRAWTLAGLSIWSVIAALGFFTIPIMLYGWGAVLVWLVLSAPRAQRRARLYDIVRSVRWTLLVTLFLYTPVLVRTGLQLLVMNRFVEPLTWSSFVSEWPAAAASVWRDWMRHLPHEAQIVLVCGFMISLIGGWIVPRTSVPLPLAAFAWSAPVVLVQRVVPFERVWLFLLPPFFMAAADGVVLVVRPLFKRIPERVGTSVVGVAGVGLALFLSSRVAISQPHPIPKIDAASAFLATYLRSGDRVVAEVPVDWPLRYYFARRGLSTDYLRPDRTASPDGRTIVAVDEAEGQTFEAVTNASGLSSGSRKQLQTFDTLSLYELGNGPQ